MRTSQPGPPGLSRYADPVSRVTVLGAQVIIVAIDQVLHDKTATWEVSAGSDVTVCVR